MKVYVSKQDWEWLIEEAERKAKDLADILEEAFQEFPLSRRELEELIDSGSLAWIETIALPIAVDKIRRHFADVLERVGQKTLNRLRLRLRFDVLNPRSVDFIQARTGELIKYINEEQRQAIREIIRIAFEQGGHPRETAKKIKQYVGLIPRHVQAVERYRAYLESEGYSQAYIDRAVERYTQKLLRWRAQTIARTETLMAANEGQRLAWDQAIEEGLLDKDEYVRVWVVTPDELLCDACAEMDGKTAPLDGEYEGGIKGPPLHPNCRCTEVLQRRREAW